MPEIRVVVSEELDRYMNTVVGKGMFGSKAELIRAALIRYFETLPLRVPRGYDDTTLFSPDGRIFQIEYAIECTTRGSVMAGMRVGDGVILAKRRFSSLVPEERTENVLSSPAWDWAVDQHIGLAPVGLLSDFILIRDKAVKESQSYRTETGEPISVEELVRRLSIFTQSFTMKKDVRPLGCIVFIAGVDETGCHLLSLDPGGGYKEVAYEVAGWQREETQKILKESYKPDISLQEALALMIKAVLKEETSKPEELAVVVVEAETKKLRKIGFEEMKGAWGTAFRKKAD